VTGSGTTDSSGNLTLSLSSSGLSAGTCAASITVTVTGPSGYGLDTDGGYYIDPSTGLVGTGLATTLGFCTDLTWAISIPPTNTGPLIQSRYWPSTLTVTDDRGTCTVTLSGSSDPGSTNIGTYTGSYTCTEKSYDDVACGPPYGTRQIINAGKTVTINVTLVVSGSTGCVANTPTIRYRRNARYTAAYPECDAVSETQECVYGTSGSFFEISDSGAVSFTSTSSSISDSESYSTSAAISCSYAALPHTSGTVTVTGTIA
jgi:hypothetical protein